jgi:hypothetical protein
MKRADVSHVIREVAFKGFPHQGTHEPGARAITMASLQALAAPCEFRPIRERGPSRLLPRAPACAKCKRAAGPTEGKPPGSCSEDGSARDGR